MAGPFGDIYQNARLQLRPGLLPDPGKFEFLLVHVSLTAKNTKKHRTRRREYGSSSHPPLGGKGANRFKFSYPFIEMSALAANSR